VSKARSTASDELAVQRVEFIGLSVKQVDRRSVRLSGRRGDDTPTFHPSNSNRPLPANIKFGVAWSTLANG
jgi:hypothetical protein